MILLEAPEGKVPVPFPSPFFFEIPLPSAQIPFPLAEFGKKSQCYTYHLFSRRIRKITASKYDPTKTQKFTRIYKDVLKITGSFQTVITVCNSNSFSRWCVCAKFPFLSLSDSLLLLFALSCGGWICDEVDGCGSSVFGKDGEFCRKTIFTEPFWNVTSRWITLTESEVHELFWNISHWSLVLMTKGAFREHPASMKLM